MKRIVTESDYQKFFHLKRLFTQRFEAFLDDLEEVLISDGSGLCTKCVAPFESDQNFCRCREDLRPLMLVCPACREARHYPPDFDSVCCVFCGASPWEPVKVSDFSGEILFPGAV